MIWGQERGIVEARLKDLGDDDTIGVIIACGSKTAYDFACSAVRDYNPKRYDDAMVVKSPLTASLVRQFVDVPNLDGIVYLEVAA